MPDSDTAPRVSRKLPQQEVLGREYNRPHDGTYLQNWNPVLLSEELPAGKIVGKDIFGTRVIIYRGADGKPVVQSAYCPHLGADLAAGTLVDGKVRCAYHHWKFDADGRCVDIPDVDKIPSTTCVYNYAAGEKWGLIWVFNGKEPLYDLPEMPNVSEKDLVFLARRHGLRPIEGWISSSNAVDFQHLKTVHGIPNPSPKTIEFDRYTLTVRQEAPHRIADSVVTGGTWLGLHSQFPGDGSERFFMAGSAQTAPGCSEAYYVVAIRKSEAEKIGEAATQARLQELVDWIYKLYSEDEPVLFSMRFRGRGKCKLVAQDKHLADFLRFIETYPRAAPFDV